MFMMNVANFAEELTHLVIKWTTVSTPKQDGSPNVVEPLTKEQVLNTTNDVYRAVLQNEFLPSDNNISTKTPATGITMTTPTAPTVPKIHTTQNTNNLGRFKSLNALSDFSTTFDRVDFLDAGVQDQVDVEDGMDKNDVFSEDKKVISRSSPAINVCTWSRSSTFVREDENIKDENKCAEEKSDVPEKNNNETLLQSEKILSAIFMQELEALRKSACDVVSRIDKVKKQTHPQIAKPIRRLSTNGGFPSLTRSSTMMRSIQPPKMRRSFTTFPGTPTSSRLNTTITTDKEEASARRKTISSSCLPVPATTKIMGHTSNRSTTGLSPVVDRRSPVSGGKPAKNPKYAHVQSTIPKLGKRKVP